MRGNELKDKARECLLVLYENDPANFKYVESELSRKADISRVTLSKWRREGIIDDWMREFPSTSKMFRDNKKASRKEIQNLTLQNKLLREQLSVLQNHICDLYMRLDSHAVQMQFVLEPTMQMGSQQDGKCLLCNLLVSDALKQ